MSQSAVKLSTTPPLPGLTAVNAINAALAVLLSLASGSATPTFGPGTSGALVLGQEWLDTTTPTAHLRKLYDGNSWVQWLVLDPTTHRVGFVASNNIKVQFSSDTFAGWIGGTGNAVVANYFQTQVAASGVAFEIYDQNGGNAANTVFKLSSNLGATRAKLFGVDGAGQVSIGSQAADSLLTINANSGVTVAPTAGTILHLVGAAASSPILEFDSYAASGAIVSRRADGTLGGKSAVGAATIIFNFLAQPWDGSAYNTSARMRYLTVNAHSVSDHSTQIIFATTPLFSTTITDCVYIQPSGGLSVGVTADPGALAILTNFFVSNSGGSVSAPAFTFSGNLNNGMYFIGTNNYGFAVNGVKKLDLSTTGLGIGGVADALLTVNANSVASPAAPLAGTVMHLVGADATTARFWMDSFGSGLAINMRAALGTAASPSVLTAGANIFALSGSGYDGSAYVNSVGRILINAFNLWVHGSDTSTFINFFTTPGASTTPAEAARINASGGISVGTTTDSGIGVVLANVGFKSGDGSVGTAGYGFTSDTSTGLYRIGTSNIGMALGGTKYIDAKTTGVAFFAPIVYGLQGASVAKIISNANATAALDPSVSFSGGVPLFHLVGADAGNAIIVVDSFNGSQGNFAFRAFGGTLAGGVAAIASNAALGQISWRGWDGSVGFAVASIVCTAAEAFTASPVAHGMIMKFNITTRGTSGASTECLRLDSGSNVILGPQVATVTSAIDGFIYIPTCAGAPSGVPTAYTGKVALIYDTTNHKLWIYDGAWKGGTVPGVWS